MQDTNPEARATAPKHIEVKLTLNQNPKARIEIDRCAGPFVSLFTYSGPPDTVGPLDPDQELLHDIFGGHSVRLTSEEAQQIGQKLLDFADHVDKYPDMRSNETLEKIKKQRD